MFNLTDKNETEDSVINNSSTQNSREGSCETDTAEVIVSSILNEIIQIVGKG